MTERVLALVDGYIYSESACRVGGLTACSSSSPLKFGRLSHASQPQESQSMSPDPT